jgi:hypothetical protein
MPILAVYLLVNVDDVQMFVLCPRQLPSALKSEPTHHPQLMAILPHQHRPMLRWVGAHVRALCDQLSQARLLGEPLSREAGDGVPPELNGAVGPTDVGRAGGDDVRLVAQAQRVLELELAFQELIFAVASSNK